jgi:hypothetical protein
MGHHNRRRRGHMGQIHHCHTGQNRHHCLVVPVETWVASVGTQMVVFVGIQMVVSVDILVVPAESLVAFLVHRIPRVPADWLQRVTCQTVEALVSDHESLEVSVAFQG